jgi:7-cyano-7-deazaguanine synthase
MAPRVKPLVSLSVDMTDVYPAAHWARTGRAPGYHTPDEDVYLPGRNIVLLGKAGVFCAAAGIGRLVIGTLDHNPFPDATPEFRETFASALSLGLAHRIEIAAPYARVEKSEVIRRAVARHVPLELTLSCMNPVIDAGVPRHCGRCSKCRERHDAFLAARINDPTDYVDKQYVE